MKKMICFFIIHALYVHGVEVITDPIDPNNPNAIQDDAQQALANEAAAKEAQQKKIAAAAEAAARAAAERKAAFEQFEDILGPEDDFVSPAAAQQTSSPQDDDFSDADQDNFVDPKNTGINITNHSEGTISLINKRLPERLADEILSLSDMGDVARAKAAVRENGSMKNILTGADNDRILKQQLKNLSPEQLVEVLQYVLDEAKKEKTVYVMPDVFIKRINSLLPEGYALTLTSKGTLYNTISKFMFEGAGIDFNAKDKIVLIKKPIS